MIFVNRLIEDFKLISFLGLDDGKFVYKLIKRIISYNSIMVMNDKWILVRY